MNLTTTRGGTARRHHALQRTQRGITMIELALGLVVMLIALSIGISYMTNLSRASARQQATDQEAREIAQLARATKQYIATNPTLFALNTNVSVTPATLATAGLLPTGFANRAGTGTSMSPFGQPYVIVARKIDANYPATAVVAESSAALQEKLPAIGVDAEANSIWGLKQDIAAQTNKNYQVIAGAIPTGSRIVQGTGGGFTKDLTSYFTGGFTEASPVGLVNFRDLEPTSDDPNDPNNPNILRRKVYQNCTYQTVGCSGNSCSLGAGWCWEPGHPTNSGGVHYEGRGPISNCSGPVITTLGFGGALTNGYTTSYYTPGGSNCPSGNQGCMDEINRGAVTMNNLTIASGTCSEKHWVSGTATTTQYNAIGVGVCCQWSWDPDYPVVPAGG